MTRMEPSGFYWEPSSSPSAKTKDTFSHDLDNESLTTGENGERLQTPASKISTDFYNNIKSILNSKVSSGGGSSTLNAIISRTETCRRWHKLRRTPVTLKTFVKMFSAVCSLFAVLIEFKFLVTTHDLGNPAAAAEAEKAAVAPFVLANNFTQQNIIVDDHLTRNKERRLSILQTTTVERDQQNEQQQNRFEMTQEINLAAEEHNSKTSNNLRGEGGQVTMKRSEDHVVIQMRREVWEIGNSTNLPVIPVVAWPYLEMGINTAENKHIEENGINESRFMTLSTDIYNFDPNVVWVGDVGFPHGVKPSGWCELFLDQIKKARAKREELGITTKSQQQLSWPIYIVDFTDGGDHRYKCQDIENLMGEEWVHYTKRSFVKHRHWNSDRNQTERGSLMSPNYKEKQYRHTPLIVRTDTIESLKQVLSERGMKLSDPIERIEREFDVTHLWPVDLKKVGPIHSKLRTATSRYLMELGEKTNITSYVGLAGKAIRDGRRGVVSAYIEALLSTKIIVVTQRDGWEDHYRLFEALVSGAMVITDQMLAKPKDVENGTALIEFTSFDDLRQKIEYYLVHKEERMAIAHYGRLVAMRRHRSWHRMEEIIFGDVLSNCTKSPGCHYVVHPNEERRR